MIPVLQLSNIVFIGRHAAVAMQAFITFARMNLGHPSFVVIQFFIYSRIWSGALRKLPRKVECTNMIISEL